MQKSKVKLPFRSNYLNVFFLCLGMAFIVFIPFIIMDHGYFTYYGDFNVQQIPFYQYAHDAVLDGDIFWNWKTDLGVNFIGSYSFYLLTSPFFWLTLLFPSSVVPMLMAPLLMLKFALAGVTGFAFIKRFVTHEQFAMIGAVLYAFCGFNQYNIFFNHFHEAVIVFPLLLVALEEFVLNGRRGCFALAVFACATVNYFFFVGQVTFTMIYFLVRCMSPEYRIGLKEFGFLIIEAVLGVMLACVILLPSVLAIADNPRTSSLYYGMDILMYSNVQRYGHILSSMFFPPDIPSRPNFFADSGSRWSSISLYLPLFSMSGVIVFFKNAKRHWLRRILGIMFIMAFIPILNSSFFAFNSSYYARWYYMPLLMMALATCISLEKVRFNMKWGVKFCAYIAAAFTLIAVLPTQEDGEVVWFSLAPYPERIWIYAAIVAVSLGLILYLLKLPRFSRKFFHRALAFTCIISVVSTMTVVILGRQHTADDIYEQIIVQGANGTIELDDDEEAFYRIDEYELQDNLPMFWGLASIQTFHSIVPVSIMNFYESIDVERNVASRPELERYGLRALTSVKYLISKEKDEPELYGFTFKEVQNGMNIYENAYYIPMGFTYDYYVNDETMEEFPKSNRDKVMLRAMHLSDEDAEKYDDVLELLPESEYLTFSEEEYYLDCEARQATAGYDFKYDTYGFTSKIVLERENLVFYSVPYEQGWTAYVNGEEAEIVVSNVGFMAVLAPEGDNTIEFKYKTPGLSLGLTASLAGLVLLLGYMFLMRWLRKKNPKGYLYSPANHRNVLGIRADVRAEQAYIKSVSQPALQSIKEERTALLEGSTEETGPEQEQSAQNQSASTSSAEHIPGEEPTHQETQPEDKS